MEVEEDGVESSDKDAKGPSLNPREFLRDWVLRANVSLRKVDELLKGLHANKIVLNYKDVPKDVRTFLKLDTDKYGDSSELIVEMQGQVPKNATKAMAVQIEKSVNGSFIYYGIERCLKMTTPGMVKREQYIRMLRMVDAAGPTTLSRCLYRVAFQKELDIEESLRNAGYDPPATDKF